MFASIECNPGVGIRGKLEARRVLHNVWPSHVYGIPYQSNPTKPLMHLLHDGILIKYGVQANSRRRFDLDCNKIHQSCVTVTPGSGIIILA